MAARSEQWSVPSLQVPSPGAVSRVSVAVSTLRLRGVAGVGLAPSTEPMSDAPPWGRAMPRWSVGRVASQSPAVPLGIAFSAGLFAYGSIVKVAPPLSVSGCTIAGVFGWSVGWAKLHEVSEPR